MTSRYRNSWWRTQGWKLRYETEIRCAQLIALARRRWYIFTLAGTLLVLWWVT